MSYTSDSTKSRDALRPIRFVIYLTTLLYGLINLVVGPGDPPSGSTPLSSVLAATVVGVVQFIAVIIAISSDLTETGKHAILKTSLLVLCLTYLYEGVLNLGINGDPFDWAPLFVYSAICAVLYLAKE